MLVVNVLEAALRNGGNFLDIKREEHVRHMFDSFCRRVLLNAANDYFDSLSRRRKHEVLIDDYRSIPYTVDTYSLDQETYDVLGESVMFTDPSIILVLNSLPAESRTIVLAACVCGLPDREIAERLNLVRRTLTYRKAKLIKELRRVLADE